MPESDTLSVNKFSVDEKRHDAFASKRGEFHAGKRIDFFGGGGQQLTQVLIGKSLPLIVSQTTFATYRSTCMEVEKIFI